MDKSEKKKLKDQKKAEKQQEKIEKQKLIEIENIKSSKIRGEIPYTIQEVNNIVDLHEIKAPRNIELKAYDEIWFECKLCGHKWYSFLENEAFKIPLWEKGKWCTLEQDRLSHLTNLLNEAQGNLKGDKFIDKINKIGDSIDDMYITAGSFTFQNPSQREEYGQRLAEDKTVVDYFMEEYKEYHDEELYKKLIKEKNGKIIESVIEEVFGKEVWDAYSAYLSEMLIENQKNPKIRAEIQKLIDTFKFENPLLNAASEVQDSMYCKHCGKKIGLDSKFCKHCGKTV